MTQSSWWGWHSCLSLLLLPILAGCIPQTPFAPAPVRFGRVDYLEARDASVENLELSLDRDVFSPHDAFVATLVAPAALAAQKPPARLVILHAGAEVARLDLADLRNTRLDVHVQLRVAGPGTYVLRAGAGSASVEKSFAVR